MTKAEEAAYIKGLARRHAEGYTALSDIESAIIRGHILYEQALNQSIELAIPNKAAYAPDRFTFSHKLAIADMMAMLGTCKPEVRALNKLRNQIAHSLAYDSHLVDLIIKEVTQKVPDVMAKHANESVARQLTASISFLCGVMSVAYKSHQASRHLNATPDTNEM